MSTTVYMYIASKCFPVFQKLRTPARPTKDIADEDGDLDDFIVDDSDIDSDDDECDSSLTWLHNADTLFQ